MLTLLVGAIVRVLLLYFMTRRPSGRLRSAALVLGALGLGLGFVPWLLALDEGALDARLLRLAAMSATALPLLALLLLDEECERRLFRWAKGAQLVGMVGLPVALVLAAFVSEHFKYATVPFADLVMFATGAGAWLAKKRGATKRAIAWTLVLLSMLAGGLMSFFAFDGPLPAPPGFAHFDDVVRASVRTVHIAVILFGIVVLVRERE